MHISANCFMYLQLPKAPIQIWIWWTKMCNSGTVGAHPPFSRAAPPPRRMENNKTLKEHISLDTQTCDVKWGFKMFSLKLNENSEFLSATPQTPFYLPILHHGLTSGEGTFMPGAEEKVIIQSQRVFCFVRHCKRGCAWRSLWSSVAMCVGWSSAGDAQGGGTWTGGREAQ